MTADLSSFAPIMKPLLNHASKFAAKQKNGKKKATAAMKVKAKVSIKGA